MQGETLQAEGRAQAQLLDAAERAIQAADQEYEVDESGYHRLIRVSVPVDEWLALMRATVEAGRESGRWGS